jgi:hypothetical protein
MQVDRRPGALAAGCGRLRAQLMITSSEADTCRKHDRRLGAFAAGYGRARTQRMITAVLARTTKGMIGGLVRRRPYSAGPVPIR